MPFIQDYIHKLEVGTGSRFFRVLAALLAFSW